ncbi:CBS domain-containing protein [Enterovirga rhinocerotis]|uniref:CBS domain protein n=1 Tax=Enterovirga rhinocerotis TaxID=1339210 RepID=A0A4R7C595_9HYPH|nr:CBS domain-containing protein [Enterovirga rhinocerotis]TDR93730.1 CBS domain protein [Enterovirga rhinocerotis]
MSVAQILAEKGRTVVTIGSEATLAEAVELLTRHRIGALVVVDPSGAVGGIVSERDVVRAVGQLGMEGLNQTVADRMTRKVATCTPTASLQELMTMMTEGKFRHVPVVEDGSLGGMVSIGDIVKHRLAEMEAESQALRDYIGAA